MTLLACLLILLSCINPATTLPKQEVPVGNELPFQRGMSVVLYNDDSTMEINVPDFFDDLEKRNLGIESLIFVFPIFQDGVAATTVYEDDALTISEEGIRIFIREAHSRNITVWLKPLIDDGRLGAGKWRGAITPGNDLSDLEALDAWYASYTQLMLKYATIAQEERALGLVIGTEMASLDKPMPKYTDRWNELIAQVRSVYDGNISYAKNWSPVELPGFVDSLDVLMIDAFFDLQSLPDDATEDQIYDAWNTHWANVFVQYQYLDIPIMFAEVGIVPRVAAYRTPWNGNNGNPVDFEAQARYYRATCRFSQDMGIDGLYWWTAGFYDHFENQFARYLRDGTLTYSFYDMPAEMAVRECYLLDW